MKRHLATALLAGAAFGLAAPGHAETNLEKMSNV
jgi:hypothetical protein